MPPFENAYMAKSVWRWEEAPVDKSLEHIEIVYGDVNAQNPEEWIPIALVSAPTAGTFSIQFLIAPINAECRKMLDSVREELNFYLIEKRETDPWNYAKYHCSTAANVYSHVHWSYYPAVEKAPATQRRKARTMKASNSPKQKTFSFGGCEFGATSPSIAELSPNTVMLNITVPFEEALKLHLAIGECIRKLNSYKRSTTAGKRTALNVAVHLGKRRITINETKRQAPKLGGITIG